ncbi:MAG: hypothetical protein V4665_04575 [Patescibacteria group bacterium]
MAYIVTPNYYDRKSPLKWLVREENQPLGTVKAVKVVIATEVIFEFSSALEAGFGCTVVAKCNEVQIYDSNPFPQFLKENELQRLQFCLNAFILPSSKDTVSRVSQLYLDENRGVWARISVKKPATNERAEEVFAL